MVGKKRSGRKRATGSKGLRLVASKTATKDALEGLRDALDLTLTRVIEDDMSVEDARSLLRYLEKELDGFEQRSRRARGASPAARRRSRAARKPGRTGER